MMARNRISLNFNGFEEYAEKLDKLNGDLKNTIEKCLKASYEIITPKIESDIKKHNRTHITEKSIDKTNKVEWNGTVASINVGFRIRDGGLPSIFLMYGTPRMKPDRQLYNDIYGTATKKQISKIQEEIFLKEIKKVMGG